MIIKQCFQYFRKSILLWRRKHNSTQNHKLRQLLACSKFNWNLDLKWQSTKPMWIYCCLDIVSIEMIVVCAWKIFAKESKLYVVSEKWFLLEIKFWACAFHWYDITVLYEIVVEAGFSNLLIMQTFRELWNIFIDDTHKKYIILHDSVNLLMSTSHSV